MQGSRFNYEPIPLQPTHESSKFNEPQQQQPRVPTVIATPYQRFGILASRKLLLGGFLMFLLLVLGTTTLTTFFNNSNQVRTASDLVEPYNTNLVDWNAYTNHSRSKHNATIVILVEPDSNMYQRLIQTLANLEQKFNERLGYPIQLLTNGQLPDRRIRERTDWITKGKAKWSVVTKEQGWGPPPWISQSTVDDSISNIGFSEGYRNMCRFFAMFHWQHPAVRAYEWVWRLDDTSKFHCELVEDPIEVMIKKQATYGYSQIQNESLYVIPTLWETTRQFLKDSKAQEKGWIPDRNWLDLISYDHGETYNLRMFYNNFEIVHRSFLESEAYQSYVSYLDKNGGFYRERWGDAPIRTIATSLFLSKGKDFHDFSSSSGYQHEYPSFKCPDLAWCDCDPDQSNHNEWGNW